MKKIFLLLGVLLMATLGITMMAVSAMSKPIVVYYSKTGEQYGVGVISEGNTAKVAKEIAAQTGADLLELKTVKDYPKGYDETTQIAQRELSENARPALSTKIPDMKGYDTVYLGFPIWWGDAPMGVYTFLDGVDLSGKTLRPFCTHEGSGAGSMQSKLQAAEKAADVQSVLAITGRIAQKDPDAVKKEVAQWLNFLDKSEKKMSTPNPQKIVQTAGRNALGKFAPEFAHFNDDILFGENWNNDKIDIKTRCIITVVALMAQGLTDSSLKYHLENAKKNGVSKDEIAAIVTHVAFYAGWPKAWAVFNMAKEIWRDTMTKEEFEKVDKFGIGLPNDAYAKYFTGKSYLKPLSDVAGGETPLFNVTFEPSCRNHWHIHHATKGGGQVLIVTAGSGWYQEWGKAPLSLEEGSVVVIPANTKHWHGAKKDAWFSHITYEPAGENTSNEWLEKVTDEEYAKLGES